jgi:hypothetical protein
MNDTGDSNGNEVISAYLKIQCDGFIPMLRHRGLISNPRPQDDMDWSENRNMMLFFSANAIFYFTDKTTRPKKVIVKESII